MIDALVASKATLVLVIVINMLKYRKGVEVLVGVHMRMPAVSLLQVHRGFCCRSSYPIVNSLESPAPYGGNEGSETTMDGLNSF